MNKRTFLLFIFVLIGCSQQESSNLGKTPIQIGENISHSEKKEYLLELNDIFGNIVLYDYVSVRSKDIYYFSYNKKYELNNIKANLVKSGWKLLEANNSGELYCDLHNNEIAIIFQKENEDDIQRDETYYSYPSFSETKIIFAYTSNNNGEVCKRGKYNAS